MTEDNKITIEKWIGGYNVTFSGYAHREKKPYIFLDSEAEEKRMFSEIAEVFGYKVSLVRK